MVRPSGDILQVFVEISPSLPLLNHLHTSMLIYVYVDFHWPHEVCKVFFTQHNGTTCIPRWFVSSIFHFHPYLGKWSNLTHMFHSWVGSTTNSYFSFLVHKQIAADGGVREAVWLNLVKFEACTAGSIRNRPVVNLDPTTLLIRQLRRLERWIHKNHMWLLYDLQLVKYD